MTLANGGSRLPAAVVLNKPRTGVFTLRHSAQQVSRCVGYEFEDMIVEELEPGGFLIEPPVEGLNQFGIRTQNFLKRRGLPFSDIDFGAERISLEQNLDLFFTSPALAHDLLSLNLVRDWRKRSAKAVCFLQELWISEIEDKLPPVRDILNQFDHVICGFYHTAEVLADKLDVPVSYMPYGVDAELWCPYRATSKPRTIDVCAIGTMDTVTHEALWAWAERTVRYYNFTTTGKAQLSVPHKVHRKNLAQTLQRSKYFFTFLAKRVVIGQRSAQQEFGPRYFEGAAAGAIQLGDPVKTNPAYLENLDWDGAVIEVPYSTADMPALIEDLERDPEWLESVRRANIANCLTRHDHLNRWEVVLKAAGLEETPAMSKRRDRLQALAVQLDETSISGSFSRSAVR